MQDAARSACRSMDTSQLLDLFTPPDKPAQPKVASKPGLKALLDGMGELWDENEYTEAFDVGAYVQSLNAQGE